MYNTIILLKGEEFLTRKEFEKFAKGDTIWGIDSDAKELKRWDISEKESAVKELKKYHSVYAKSNQSYTIEEYALEYCECDEDGGFILGSDFDLAEER